MPPPPPMTPPQQSPKKGGGGGKFCLGGCDQTGREEEDKEKQVEDATPEGEGWSFWRKGGGGKFCLGRCDMRGESADEVYTELKSDEEQPSTSRAHVKDGRGSKFCLGLCDREHDRNQQREEERREAQAATRKQRGSGEAHEEDDDGCWPRGRQDFVCMVLLLACIAVLVITAGLNIVSLLEQLANEDLPPEVREYAASAVYAVSDAAGGALHAVEHVVGVDAT